MNNIMLLTKKKIGGHKQEFYKILLYWNFVHEPSKLKYLKRAEK